MAGIRVTSRNRRSPKGRASSIQPPAAARHASTKSAISAAWAASSPANTYVARPASCAASDAGRSQTDRHAARLIRTSGHAAPTAVARASAPAHPAQIVNSILPRYRSST